MKCGDQSTTNLQDVSHDFEYEIIESQIYYHNGKKKRKVKKKKKRVNGVTLSTIVGESMIASSRVTDIDPHEQETNNFLMMMNDKSQANLDTLRINAVDMFPQGSREIEQSPFRDS